jgi:hypothetical protein
MKVKDTRRVRRARAAFPEKVIGKSDKEVLLFVKGLSSDRQKANRLIARLIKR